MFKVVVVMALQEEGGDDGEEEDDEGVGDELIISPCPEVCCPLVE